MATHGGEETKIETGTSTYFEKVDPASLLDAVVDDLLGRALDRGRIGADELGHGTDAQPDEGPARGNRGSRTTDRAGVDEQAGLDDAQERLELRRAE